MKTLSIDLHLEGRLMRGRQARRAMAAPTIRLDGTRSVPLDTTSLLMQQIAQRAQEGDAGTILPIDYFLQPNWRDE